MTEQPTGFCQCEDCVMNGYECDLETYDGEDRCPPCLVDEHPGLQPTYGEPNA